MLEIIALVFICRNNSKIAKAKGQDARRWILFTVLAWVGAEILGAGLAMHYFGQNLLAIMTWGIAFAAMGQILLYRALISIPNKDEENF